VLYLASNGVMKAWIHGLNPHSENLQRFYSPRKRRTQTYSEIVARTLTLLDEGLDVCLVVYGHPGIATDPTHEAMRQARTRGHRSEMIPGISTLDCLSADLGIDPVMRGCQVYDATEFLLYDRSADPTSALILFQIGMTANLKGSSRTNRRALQVLTNRLKRSYARSKTIVLYEAALWPIVAPRIESIRLLDLPKSEVTPATTLYIPPEKERKLNMALSRRLLTRLERA
jgi:hypothetical protein